MHHVHGDRDMGVVMEDSHNTIVDDAPSLAGSATVIDISEYRNRRSSWPRRSDHAFQHLLHRLAHDCRVSNACDEDPGTMTVTFFLDPSAVVDTVQVFRTCQFRLIFRDCSRRPAFLVHVESTGGSVSVALRSERGGNAQISEALAAIYVFIPTVYGQIGKRLQATWVSTRW